MLIWILFSHFIADFVCQTDKVAKSKSSDFGFLTEHVNIYILVLVMVGYIPLAMIFKFEPSLVFLWNYPSHFIIDAITSRITTYLYLKEKRHWFFVVIGLDQFLHTAILILTI